jgi:hypothetical protein
MFYADVSMSFIPQMQDAALHSAKVSVTIRQGAADAKL